MRTGLQNACCLICNRQGGNFGRENDYHQSSLATWRELYCINQMQQLQTVFSGLSSFEREMVAGLIRTADPYNSKFADDQDLVEEMERTKARMLLMLSASA